MAIEVLPVIKDCVTIIATVTGASVALIGLSAWKRQLRGKENYDLARRLLRAAYSARDAIAMIRSPLITGGEFDEALREVNKAPGTTIPDTTDYVRYAAVYQHRW